MKNGMLYLTFHELRYWVCVPQFLTPKFLIPSSIWDFHWSVCFYYFSTEIILLGSTSIKRFLDITIPPSFRRDFPLAGAETSCLTFNINKMLNGGVPVLLIWAFYVHWRMVALIYILHQFLRLIVSYSNKYVI